MLLWHETLNNVPGDVFKEFGFKLLLAFSQIFNHSSARIVKYSSELHLVNYPIKPLLEAQQTRLDVGVERALCPAQPAPRSVP